jgi:hypothetical protein
VLAPVSDAIHCTGRRIIGRGKSGDEIATIRQVKWCALLAKTACATR